MTQTPVTQRVPSLPIGPITDEKGNPTANEQMFRQSLIDLLQNFVGDEGIVIPTQSPEDLLIIQDALNINNVPTCDAGTILYQQDDTTYTADVFMGAYRNSDDLAVPPLFKPFAIGPITPGFTSISMQTFTTSGTYTPTTGMAYCIVEIVGGGGGSGGAYNATTSNTCSGGGAGSGYARASFSASTIGASQTVTIGAGGTAGNDFGGNGGTGGTSSLGSLLVVPGGAGSLGVSMGGAGAGALGSDTSTGPAGYFSVAGGDGCEGITGNTVSLSSVSGGGSYFGGGLGITGSTTTTWGAGAAGSHFFTGSPGVAGSVGAQGVIVVTEYIIA